MATYTRISTDEVNQPYSLEAQAQMLGKYIESQPNMVHVASYTDQKSGATIDRPELQRLLKDAPVGVFDVVLVYRLDRLARSLKLVHDIFDQLQRADVGLRSATEPFDTVTAGGRMMMNILATFAQFERDVLIDRITAGMRTKASRGEWPGGQAPYGYEVIDGKTLGIVETEAAVIRRIFKMCDEERLGSPQIAAQLNESGARTRTGQHWSFKRVLDALRRPTYAGWIVNHDDAFEGLHEPIIDRETFDRVQTILNERADASARQVSSEYVLSGLIRCAVCGRAVVGVSAHGSKNKYRYYICAGRNEKGTISCASKRVSADAVEQIVRDQIVRLYAKYDLFEQAALRAIERRDTARPALEAEIAALRAELGNTDLAVNRYFTAFEQGTMPEALCSDRIRELHSKAESVRHRIVEVDLELQAKPPELPTETELEELAERVATALSQPPTPALRAFLAAVIDRIELGANRQVHCFLRVPNTSDAIVDPAESDEDRESQDATRWDLLADAGRAPRRRMRHVTCYDAVAAAVKDLTQDDPAVEISTDEIEDSVREAGHSWSRETIIKVINRDLAGIGSGKNAPRYVPILERLPGGGRFKLRQDEQ